MGDVDWIETQKLTVALKCYLCEPLSDGLGEYALRYVKKKGWGNRLCKRLPSSPRSRQPEAGGPSWPQSPLGSDRAALAIIVKQGGQ